MANVQSSKREMVGNANEPASKKQRNNRDISDAESLISNRDVSTSILITPRENEFNSRTWWMVDLHPASASSPQGATELVKRCMASYSWDEVKSRKVLAAYRQFLTLKKMRKDWNAEVLSPCYLVDQMWHCHILDVVNYCHDMMLLCGQVVGHNPSGALDIEAKKKRDHDTRVCLLEEFGEYDKEVWDYSPNAATATAVNDRDAQNAASGNSNGRSNEVNVPNSDGEVERTSNSSAMKSGNAAGEYPGSDPTNEAIRIFISDPTGEQTMFKIKRSCQMGNVFNVYARKKGVEDINSTRFLIEGERIYDYKITALSLGLNDGDKIDCFSQLCGC